MDGKVRYQLKKLIKEICEVAQIEDSESCDCMFKWKKVEVEVPHNERIVLVSYWDTECEGYSYPIQAVYHSENEIFYKSDYPKAIPIHVEIWCELPPRPDRPI